MKMAIAVRRGNVSWTFHQATGFLVADLDPRNDGAAFEVPVQGKNATLMAEHLSRLDVQVVLCGDLSPAMVAALDGYGIRVVCGVRGEAAALVRANRARRPDARKPSLKEPRGCFDFQGCCDPGVGVRARSMPETSMPETSMPETSDVAQEH